MKTPTHISAWKSLSQRIKGIEKAAKLHAEFLKINVKSPYGADKYLQRQFELLLGDMETYTDTFGNMFPDAARSAIETFISDCGKQIRDNKLGDSLMNRTIAVKLIAFDAELSHVFGGADEQIRAITESALRHLQHLILLDEQYRNKWIKAVDQHETICEALGALHFLWHGIWAFKVDAKGGRTDLVYHEPINERLLNFGGSLVLTEWKRCSPISGTKSDLANAMNKKFMEAHSQAKRYSASILSGFELATHRYLIVVSMDEATPPNDFEENGVIYRHVNIAANPRMPSRGP